MKNRYVAAVIIFLVTFAVPVTIYSVVSRKNSYDNRNLAAEETSGERGGTSAPQIVSVPITEAEVGKQYQYKVRAVDSDDDEIDFIIKEKPEWLTWDDGLEILQGTPGADDLGYATVQISASDGKWLNTQRFQISVIGEEGNVKEGSSAQEDAGDSEDAPPVVESQTEEVEDISEYGLSPVSQAEPGANDDGTVLGTQTQLPDTALPGGFLVVVASVSVFFVAFFFWADARWDLMGRLMLWYDYSRGKQIRLKLEDGTYVDKKKGRFLDGDKAE